MKKTFFKKRVKWVARLIVAFMLFSLSQCMTGSNLVPQASIPAPTLRIEGSVSSPGSSSNLTVAALTTDLDVSFLTSAADSSAKGNIFTLDGENLGSFKTDSTGQFEMDVDVASLKGSEDTGTTWSEDVILQTRTGIELYKTITVTEGTTDSVNIGDANEETTLATQTLATNFSGFSTWGEDYKSASTAIDSNCLYLTEKELWNNVALSDAGVSDEQAQIKEIFSGFLASGASPQSLGYASWEQFLQDLLNGQSDDKSLLDDILDAASGADSAVLVDTFTDSYDDASDVLSTVTGLLAGEFTSTGLGSSLGLCDDIKDGDLDASVVFEPILAADDSDSLKDTLTSDEGLKVHLGLVQKCVEDGSCDTFKDKPAAVFGYLEGFGGDYTPIYNVVTGYNSDEIKGAISAAKNCTGSTAEELRKCAIGVNGIIQDGGGIENFKRDGVIDDNKMASWAGYIATQVVNGAVPPKVTDNPTYYQTLKTTVGSAFNSATTASTIKDCIATNTASGIVDNTQCFDGRVTIQCGNSVCDANETAANCPRDCASGTTGTFAGGYDNNKASGNYCFEDTNVFLTYNSSTDAVINESYDATSSKKRTLSISNFSGGVCVASLDSNACSCSYTDDTTNKTKNLNLTCIIPSSTTSGTSRSCSVNLYRSATVAQASATAQATISTSAAFKGNYVKTTAGSDTSCMGGFVSTVALQTYEETADKYSSTNILSTAQTSVSNGLIVSNFQNTNSCNATLFGNTCSCAYTGSGAASSTITVACTTTSGGTATTCRDTLTKAATVTASAFTGKYGLSKTNSTDSNCFTGIYDTITLGSTSPYEGLSINDLGGGKCNAKFSDGYCSVCTYSGSGGTTSGDQTYFNLTCSRSGTTCKSKLLKRDPSTNPLATATASYVKVTGTLLNGTTGTAITVNAITSTEDYYIPSASNTSGYDILIKSVQNNGTCSAAIDDGTNSGAGSACTTCQINPYSSSIGVEINLNCGGSSGTLRRIHSTDLLYGP